jgi:hypothetical protein
MKNKHHGHLIADEFIATPVPQSAAELIGKCLAGGLSSTILKWRLISCVDCLGIEIEDWKSALRKAGGPGAFVSCEV